MDLHNSIPEYRNSFQRFVRAIPVTAALSLGTSWGISAVIDQMGEASAVNNNAPTLLHQAEKVEKNDLAEDKFPIIFLSQLMFVPCTVLTQLYLSEEKLQKQLDEISSLLKNKRENPQSQDELEEALMDLQKAATKLEKYPDEVLSILHEGLDQIKSSVVSLTARADENEELTELGNEVVTQIENLIMRRKKYEVKREKEKDRIVGSGGSTGRVNSASIAAFSNWQD